MATSDAPKRARREPFDRLDEVPRSTEQGFGSGTYRRRILLRLEDSQAWGELEDDFHHFRVEIDHDGDRVTSVRGSGLRSPWTACLTAGQPLEALLGTALATGPLALSALEARQNCTHMFDLAGLLVNHVARGIDGDRLYDMAVDDAAPGSGERKARLWRDGVLLLDWHLRQRTVLAPSEWVDAPLWDRFIPWADRELDHETGEAAVALRRACDISHGRAADLDLFESAVDLLDTMRGTCHAFQPENARVALRRKGSGRDFAQHEELLLADFDSRRP